MSAVVADDSKALRYADAARADPDAAGPYHLWQLADREASSPPARVRLYRHAMIHAGYLLSSRGRPYRICRICRAKLG